MNIVIIEDENFAARRLENMITEFDSTIRVVAKIESVVESIEWFQNNPTPDLIFMDIHLEDNHSFAIFDHVSIRCPIVFTTATDEIPTRTFKQKKIDILLKPIVKDELEKLISKYKVLPDSSRRTFNADFFADVLRKRNS